MAAMRRLAPTLPRGLTADDFPADDWPMLPPAARFANRNLAMAPWVLPAFVAYGIKDGQAVAERPMAIVADGRKRPVLDLNGRPIPGVPPGAMQYGNRPHSHCIDAGVEVAGQSLGGGTYEVSPDGRTLTVITQGMGLKGPFKTTAVFDRVVPGRYLPR